MIEEDPGQMQQGYSGSTVRRQGEMVVKVTTDEAFASSPEKQARLVALSRQVDFLPKIEKVQGARICMAYVEGQEGLTLQNAGRAGNALRQLHEQTGYPHLCLTGIAWLVELANANLTQAGETRRISPEIIYSYPADVLIHSEPIQFIEQPDGHIVFIDFEGIGMGSRYHDLGQIYRHAANEDHPALYENFIRGYQSAPVQIQPARVIEIAGLESLAYAGFGLLYVGQAEFDRRLSLGLRLLARSRFWQAV